MSTIWRRSPGRLLSGKVRSTFLALTVVLLAGTLTRAQIQPAFEVATVKPSDFPARMAGTDSGTFTSRGTTLKDLIEYAYSVHPGQVAGGPNWIDSAKYDVVAKPPAGATNAGQFRTLLRTLLADRFQLVLRHDTKDMPAYALVVAKGGPKMTARKDGDGGAPSSFLISGPNWPVRNASMAQVASVLQMMVLDRPVLDKTALTGNFDFDLVWVPDETQFGGRGASIPIDANGPDIFKAVQDQLGLRLEAQKGPVDILVIDRAEKPSEN